MPHTVKSKEAYIETASGVEVLSGAVISTEGGRISAVGTSGGVSIDLSEYRILPGLVDIHIHGGDGVDVMDTTEDAVRKLAAFKLREGVTSFCPATVTAPLERTKKAIAAVKAVKASPHDKEAKIIGAFLEGPYIDPVYKGAHPEAFIREISIDELRELADIGEGSIISAAIAPNLPGAIEAIKFLKSRGIIPRIGHGNATLAEANAAIAAGAGIVIHTYNAMSPLTHREPGFVGAALTNPDVYCEIICDLVHVHPTAARLLVNARGADKVVMITDCMTAGGLGDGDYMLGELSVTVKDSQARITDSGTLAGSIIGLITAVKNMHEAVGVPLADAVRMASLTPAQALGRADIGGIRPGKQADLIAIDADYNVKFVMLDGKIVLDER
ncbi:MAG: N-acetylglucosamine-6-phosphate deacetylase [Defluviitaleaceae bacterium]|nr:N-acetylglucosamine-6-phosphate deacetylase [Defluviitaleaceae bacterium]